MNIFLSESLAKFSSLEHLVFGVFTKDVRKTVQRNCILDCTDLDVVSLIDIVTEIEKNKFETNILLNYSIENLKLARVLKNNRSDLNFGLKINERFILSSVMCFENSIDFICIGALTEKSLISIKNLRNNSIYSTKIFLIDCDESSLEHIEAVCYLNKLN